MEVRGDERNDAADQIIERAKYEAVGGLLEYPDRWLVAIVRSASALRGRSKRDRLFGMTKLFGYKLTQITRVILNRLDGDARKSTLDAVFNDKEHLGVAAKLFRDQLFAGEEDAHTRERAPYLANEELDRVLAQQWFTTNR